jgi:hypothetical protein
MMFKIKLSLLLFLCFPLACSQFLIKEKALKVMDFKIIDNDTLKVDWYPGKSGDKKSTSAISFFLEGDGKVHIIPISRGKLRIFHIGE